MINILTQTNWQTFTYIYYICLSATRALYFYTSVPKHELPEQSGNGKMFGMMLVSVVNSITEPPLTGNVN